jgi:hypothetical protein
VEEGKFSLKQQKRKKLCRGRGAYIFISGGLYNKKQTHIREKGFCKYIEGVDKGIKYTKRSRY